MAFGGILFRSVNAASRRVCGHFSTSTQLKPLLVSSMILLDKDRFKKTLSVPSISVEKSKLQDILLHVKPLLLKQLSQPGIVPNKDKEGVSNVYLDPERVKAVEDLGEAACSKMRQLGIPEELHFSELQLTYDNLKIEEVLSQLMPEHPLSSWSIIGHIAHLNLKDHHLPYKYVIGQVLLDKLKPAIKLVVNKTSTIENKFRIFPMEVLARESDDVKTIVETKSGNCRFQFDFAAVYWNPRLDTEHRRIIETLRPGMDVLYDVFAGVGPFSIAAAKYNCKVLANDLNPESYKWLQKNAELNKVTKHHSSFCMDGYDFIRTVVRDDLVAEWEALNSGEETRVKRFAITMNLPQLGIQFLSAFVGWFDDCEQQIRQLNSMELPVIHCYTFIKGLREDENEKAAVDAAESVLGTGLKDYMKEVKLVRKVSPNKFYTRISFTLPFDACFSEKQPTKKLKTDNCE